MKYLDTWLVHPPRMEGERSGAISTPIYQAATFDVIDGDLGYDYSRSGNPTRHVLEQQFARLHGGATAMAYASGIAAVDGLLGLVGPGDEVFVGGDLYGGTVRLLEHHRSTRGIEVSPIDPNNPQAWLGRVAPGRVILLESLSNPLMVPSPIGQLAVLLRGRGAVLAVDNSMLSPYLYRPLEHGADLVLESATKLLGGHSDVTAGMIATNCERLAEGLRFTQNAQGTALAPQESWLLLRGMETLGVRIDRQLASATVILEWLQNQPSVRDVFASPMIRDDKSIRRPGGVVLSFTTGSSRASYELMKRVRIFRRAVSFGGVASSISMPMRMSHASLPPDDPRRHSIPEDLIRLSIGIENVDDLLGDLDRAMGEATASSSSPSEARVHSG